MIGIINAMEIENNSVLSLCKDIKERTISGKKFYEPAENKQEEALRSRLEVLWPKYYK